jgi:hypothetical protein
MINFQTVWLDLLDFLGMAYWVEIVTDRPNCIYYFGPFTSEIEANIHIPAYVSDLNNERAEGIQVSVKRGRAPQQLTIERELLHT